MLTLLAILSTACQGESACAGQWGLGWVSGGCSLRRSSRCASQCSRKPTLPAPSSAASQNSRCPSCHSHSTPSIGSRMKGSDAIISAATRKRPKRRHRDGLLAIFCGLRCSTAGFQNGELAAGAERVRKYLSQHLVIDGLAFAFARQIVTGRFAQRVGHGAVAGGTPYRTGTLADTRNQFHQIASHHAEAVTHTDAGAQQADEFTGVATIPCHVIQRCQC